MAYELVQSGSTQFSIDWSVVRRLIRSYYTSCYQLDYGKEVTLSDSTWYNPLSWALPDVSHIEVDWDAVRRRTDAETDLDLRLMREDAKNNAPGVASRLESMIETAARNKETFVDWMGEVQTQNMKSVDQAVEAYESKIEFARFVRDRSADGLMIGASVMSGGSALAVMGAGSILTGEAKFQDTGSVGAAVMEGAGTFTFAYVKLGKTFSFKQNVVLAFVQAPYKIETELVAGSTLGEAALSGALTLTDPAVDGLLNLKGSKTLFEKVAVPLKITYRGENVAAEVLNKFTGAMIQKGGIEDAGKKALLGRGSRSETDSDETPRRHGSVVAQATLTDKYLLYLAFVNMNKGIGRGW